MGKGRISPGPPACVTPQQGTHTSGLLPLAKRAFRCLSLFNPTKIHQILNHKAQVGSARVFYSLGSGRIAGAVFLRTMDEIPSSSSSWIRFTGFRSCCRDLLCRESWEGDRGGDSEHSMAGSHQHTRQRDTGHRMASKPWLLPTAKGTFGSPGRPIWLQEMCKITEGNVQNYRGNCAELRREMCIIMVGKSATCEHSLAGCFYSSLPAAPGYKCCVQLPGEKPRRSHTPPPADRPS